MTGAGARRRRVDLVVGVRVDSKRTHGVDVAAQPVVGARVRPPRARSRH